MKMLNQHIVKEARKDPKVQVEEYMDYLADNPDMSDKLTVRCAELIDKWGDDSDNPVSDVRERMGDDRFLKFLRKTVPLVEPKPRDMGAHTFI